MASRAFDREGWHYSLGQYLGYAGAVAIMVNNVDLSVRGLTALGWEATTAQTAAIGMAIAESLVCILLTSPEWLADAYQALTGAAIDDVDAAPTPARWAGIVFWGVVVVFILSVLYGFDFWSTHIGLWGREAEIGFFSAGMTLFFNLGSEILALLAGQAKRIGRIVKVRALEETKRLEPENIYHELMTRELKKLAKEAAKAESQRKWQEFRSTMP